MNLSYTLDEDGSEGRYDDGTEGPFPITGGNKAVIGGVRDESGGEGVSADPASGLIGREDDSPWVSGRLGSTGGIEDGPRRRRRKHTGSRRTLSAWTALLPRSRCKRGIEQAV